MRKQKENMFEEDFNGEEATILFFCSEREKPKLRFNML